MKPEIQIRLEKDGSLYLYHAFGRSVVIKLIDLNGASMLQTIPTNIEVKVGTVDFLPTN